MSTLSRFIFFRYLDEQAVRFNRRGLDDGELFEAVCGGIGGKRLTYPQLIGKAAPV